MNSRTILEKMGWNEGDGLGRNNQGITSAIKPKIQFDRNGLGHSVASCLIDPWWAKVFNETAQNVSVPDSSTCSQTKESTKRHKRKISSQDKPNDGQRSTTEKQIDKCPRKKRSVDPEGSSVTSHLNSIKQQMYKNFIKSSSNDHQRHDGNSSGQNESAVPEMSINKCDVMGELEKKATCDSELIENPINIDMWKRCGRRTGHKGGRYGVLKGKMERISRQESEHLVAVSRSNINR